MFKYKTPGESGYALPGRYRAGKTNDCGVYLDYMHVGVVTQTQPLRITHCTFGGVRVDSALGKWRARGRLRLLCAEDRTPPAEEVKRPTLRSGSRGDPVKLLQRLLNAQGAALAEDGIFGKLTEQAVRDYQRRRALTVDGVVGPMTWRALTQEAA